MMVMMMVMMPERRLKEAYRTVQTSLQEFQGGGQHKRKRSDETDEDELKNLPAERV